MGLQVFKTEAGFLRAPLTEKTSMQEVFDAVVQRLRDGTGRSFDSPLDSGGACVYRDPKGNACAIGILIPEEKYDSGWEGSTADDVLRGLHLLDFIHSDEPETHVGNTLAVLQGIHDDETSWAPDGTFSPQGERRLKTAATRYGLVYTAPPEET